MSDVPDVLDTLLALQEVSENALAAAANSQQATKEVTIADPPPELLHAVEPNFVEGYDVDIEEVWDAYKRGENILIVGPPGTGKSSLAFHMLDRANESIRKGNREIYEKNLALLKKGKTEKDLIPYKDIPYHHRYTGCSSGIRNEHIIGTVKFKATDTGRDVIEVLGDGSDAFANGKTWILDEVMAGPPDVMIGAHQFLDRRVQSTDVFINGAMTLRRHPRFRVIATDNTWGLGENAAEFAGTQLHNGAFLNRFTYRVELDYLKPIHETSVIMKSYSAAWQPAVDKMVEIANKLRQDKKTGVITQAMTTRTLLSWVRECLDREKRIEKTGEKPRRDIKTYWNSVVFPAVFPTYLTGNPDAMSIQTYFEMK